MVVSEGRLVVFEDFSVAFNCIFGSVIIDQLVISAFRVIADRSGLTLVRRVLTGLIITIGSVRGGAARAHSVCFVCPLLPLRPSSFHSPSSACRRLHRGKNLPNLSDQIWDA